MSLFKSVVLFSAIATVTFFQNAAAQYSVNLPYKQVSVENLNGVAVFDGAPSVFEPGQPNLPGYTVLFLIPPDVNFEDVTVSLVNPFYEELSGTYDVAPAPFIRIPDPNGNIIDGKDTSIYRLDDFYPADFKGSVVFDQFWHYKLVSVEVFPYRYNPVRNKLRKLTGGVIEISFEVNGTPSTVSRMPGAESELSQRVVNPQVLDTYGTAPAPSGPAPSDPTSYAIITTNEIYAPSPGGCKDMIDAYETQLGAEGYTDVRIVTETSGDPDDDHWAYDSDPDKRGQNIRSWIENNATTPEVWNVLLIGNPNPNVGDVPMARMTDGTPHWDDYYGTDYFYSDIKSPWRKPDVDWPEIAVGRIPVYSTSDYPRLRIYLQRAIDYKNATVDEREKRRFALIPIVPSFWYSSKDFDIGEETVINGKNTGDGLKTDGWEFRRLYRPYSYAKFFGIHPDVPIMNPLPEVAFCEFDNDPYRGAIWNWNKYEPGLVVFFTHGSPVHATRIISSGGCQSFTDETYPAIVISGSCAVGHAQTEGNLGSEIMYNNAVAFIGGTEDLTPDAFKQIVCPSFITSMKSNASVGDALKEIHTKGAVAEENKRLVLYGCPEIKLNLPKAVQGPQTLSATRISNSQIDLEWADNVSNPQRYYIERTLQDPSIERADRSWQPLKDILAPTNTYSDLSVSPDNVYLYRVRATTNGGDNSGYSPVDSASTYAASLLPGKPGNVTAATDFPYDCNSAKITWDAPATGGTPTYYNVKRSYDGAPFVTLYSTTQTEFIDRNLLNGETFSYTVSASNQYGEGVNSATSSATPNARSVDQASTPTFTLVDNIECNRFTVHWEHPAPNGYADDYARMYTSIKYRYTDKLTNELKEDEYKERRNARSTTFEETSFENNQSVQFRIGACNGRGCSEYTDWESASTDPGQYLETPGNVALTQVTPEKVVLSWDPSSSVPAPHGYHVYRKKKDNSSYSMVATVDAATPPSRFTEEFTTKEGTDYTFAIRSYYENGACKSYSDYVEENISAKMWPVNEPENLTAWTTSTTKIELTWTDKTAGEMEFWIERRERLPDGDWSDWPRILTASANATSYTDDILVEEGKEYQYRIRATLPAGAAWWPGYSDWSLSNVVSTVVDNNRPEVSFGTFESPSTTEIDITWYPIVGTEVIEYILDRSIAPSSTSNPPDEDDDSKWTRVTTQPGSVHSYQVTGLKPSKRDEYYWFRLRAETWAGDGDWAVREACTAPGTPEDFSANAVSGSHVNVTWAEAETNTLNYSFEYSLVDPPVWSDINPWDDWNLLDGDETSVYFDRKFEPGKTYWFRICALNLYGISDYSEVSVTTPADPCDNNVMNSGGGSSGFVFGAAPPWDEGSEYCKATDGDPSTFYDYAQADGGFTGLRFNSPKTIVGIRFYPRAGFEGRMVGGIFQGSNTPDFSTAEVLYTIPSTPAAGWNEVPEADISCSESCLYVRYLSPNGGYGNIAEMEFYEPSTNTYSIYASTSDLGMISPDGNVEVPAHTDVTFTISKDPGYSFPFDPILEDVVVDGESVGAVTTYEFKNVTDGHNIYAEFTQPTRYEAEEASLGNGVYVATDHNNYSGTGFVAGFCNNPSASITFVADVPYNFLNSREYVIKLRYSAGNGESTNTGLYINGNKAMDLTCPGTGNWETWADVSVTVPLDEILSIIEFISEGSTTSCINIDYIEILAPHLIDVQYASYGSIIPSDDVAVPHGGSRTFTFEPDPYYELENVTVDGTDLGPISPYTFSNVTEDHTIGASFKKSIRYEAENLTTNTLYGSAYIDDDHNNYSGTGFVAGLWNNADAGLNTNVSCDRTGTYEINVHYSAGNGTSANNMEFIVNGVQKNTITFPGTSDWDTWADVSVLADLESGTNALDLLTKNAEHECINIDYLTIDYLGNLTLEAEDAEFLGSAHWSTNHSGYSGDGFVDGFYETDNAAVRFSRYKLDLQSAAIYEVTLRYSAGNGESSNTGLFVNDTWVKDITCPATTDWETWGEISTLVTLGTEDDLSFKAADTPTDDCINLDRITLRPESISPISFLKVTMLDQTPGSNQKTQPRFFIENESGIPLSNFTMKYYFTVEESKSPVLENYYMSPYCNATISQIFGNDYCVVIDFPGTLEAGARFPDSEEGLNFGLHYSDWSTAWNQSNDFSQPTGSSYTLTDKVAIFNSSNQLLYGSEPVLPTLIEAENTAYCSWSSGTTVDDNHEGFSGTGFVNAPNAIGEWIQCQLDVPSDGVYRIIVRYANGSTARGATLTVNGSTGTTGAFVTTNSWTNWAEQTFENVSLDAGTNTIRLTATTEGGLANIDWFGSIQ